MYREFYQLTCAPFATTSHEESAFLSVQHQTAIEAVIHGIDQPQGIMALVGEAGLGKTTLLRAALNRHQESLKTIYINQTMTAAMGQAFPKSIIRSISQELGQEIQDGSFSEMVQHLQDALIQSNQDGKKIVIVVDNAHCLSFETLHALPQIINVFPYKQKFAQFILIGPLALKKQLRQPQLKDLQPHIGLISTLSRLKKKDSRTYIQNTLHRATSQPQAILSRQALHTIVRAAQGIPRNLNMLCTDALITGCQNHQNPISGRLARQVVAELGARPAGHAARLRWLSAVGAMVAVGLFILFTSGRGPAIPTHPTPMIAMARPETPAPTQVDQPETPAPTQVDQAEPQRVVAAATTSILPTLPLTLSPVTSAPKQVMQRVTALMQQAFPTGGDFPLKIWTSKGPEGVYHEKDILLVNVLAEADAYLQIDYYQVDGQVIHLLPNLLDSNRVTAGQIFTLGNSGNTLQFEVTPPFGAEMLTVVASQAPLQLPTGTPTIEPAADYVEKLANHLKTYKTQGKAAVAVLRIRTAAGFPTHLSRTASPEPPFAASRPRQTANR